MEIKVEKIEVTRKSYPILWIKAREISVTRIGRLVKIVPSPEEKLPENFVVPKTLIIPEIKMIGGCSMELKIGFMGQWYIIAGGVPSPILGRVLRIFKGDIEKLEKFQNLLHYYGTLVTAGGKPPHYILEEINCGGLFEPFTGKAIGKDYPDTYLINGNKKTITLLPRKDDENNLPPIEVSSFFGGGNFLNFSPFFFLVLR